jgi:hypothetical protein
MRETVALAVVLGAFWRAARLYAVVLVGLMAYSRVLFGAHYPTDVQGGTVMGLWSGGITLAALNAARLVVARVAEVPRVRRSWEYVMRVRWEGHPDRDPLPARLTRVAASVVAAQALLVVVGIAGGNAWAENVLELLNDTHAWIAARLPRRPATLVPATTLVAAAGLAVAGAFRGRDGWRAPSRKSVLTLGVSIVLAAQLLLLGGVLFGRAEQDAAGGPVAPFPDPYPLFATALVSAMAVRSKRFAVSGQALAISTAATGVLSGTATIHAALAGYLVGAATGPLAHQMVSQFVPAREGAERRGEVGG